MYKDKLVSPLRQIVQALRPLSRVQDTGTQNHCTYPLPQDSLLPWDIFYPIL